MIDFNRIELQNISSLLVLLDNINSTNTDYIRRVYKRENQHFQETVKLLDNLGLIHNSNGKLNLNKQIAYLLDNSSINQQELKNEILNNFAFKSNKYRAAILEYLHQFSIKNGQLIHRPTLDERVKYSGIRNFLIELDIIVYNKPTNQYAINDKYLDNVFEIMHSNNQFSPEQLNKQLEEKAKLGLKAELEIIKFEKNKLRNFPDQSKKIKHVSLIDVSAGYDILSWLQVKNIFYPKYIEVKAVPQNDFSFHWSRNEVLKAKELKEYYYLYLLPVEKNSKFNMEKIQIIENPYKKVFVDKESWSIIEESFLVSKI